jgi:hypothetical protein
MTSEERKNIEDEIVRLKFEKERRTIELELVALQQQRNCLRIMYDCALNNFGPPNRYQFFPYTPFLG